jgi:hypothetical protein
MRYREFNHHNPVTDEQQQQSQHPKFDWETELNLDDYMFQIGREDFGECPVGITVDTLHSWEGDETRSGNGLVVLELDQIWASVLEPDDTTGSGEGHWINITDDLPEDLEEEFLRQYADAMERKNRGTRYMTAWEYENES